MKQVKVNIPLLEMGKQVFVSAKFLEDLCTEKTKISIDKKAFLLSKLVQS